MGEGGEGRGREVIDSICSLLAVVTGNGYLWRAINQTPVATDAAVYDYNSAYNHQCALCADMDPIQVALLRKIINYLQS